MTVLAEAFVALLLVAGGIFGLVGSFGLLKLPDTMTRLHAPTKATTLGVGSILIASILATWLLMGQLTWHELLIALFLFPTAPITATFIAKAHLHREMTPADLPPTGTDRTWATFEEDAKVGEADPEAPEGDSRVSDEVRP